MEVPKKLTDFPKIDTEQKLIEGASFVLNASLKMIVKHVKDEDLSPEEMATMVLSTYIARVLQARVRGVASLSLATDIATAEMEDKLKESIK